MMTRGCSSWPPNLGQVAGPNGEIVDFRTGKVVVPVPAKSVSGNDGLGEGEDRLELVEDLPPPCPTCNGCGRQGIGFGSQTEPLPGQARRAEQAHADPRGGRR